ncbi:taxadiene 5-alpha hydroxylase-like isoform X2 [Prunus yedoensis var. nudiflora]|uniref:Taxadiene 5-alpha hydroxylase-like isoform X2 n=1 Tax=Prunus yedoensis var. nudiflora TaxID=2094558 RepID=A0A314US21_PRUYE|nr:taxadiene 5-alpha hydroxylase-like isoform X2 [Prunus yedoensis var. nudiflora]
MGSPTVVAVGQAGNKFVLGTEEDVLSAKKPVALVAIAGKQNIFELTGSRLVCSINFPGTVYWRGLRARSRIVSRILPILKERREEILQGKLSPTSNVFSCLLALRDENEQPISVDLILDNYVTFDDS